MDRRNVSQRRYVPKPKFLQGWQLQRAGFRDMSERVPANVAVVRRVRQLTDADAVENNPDYPFESCHPAAPAKSPQQ